MEEKKQMDLMDMYFRVQSMYACTLFGCQETGDAMVGIVIWQPWKREIEKRERSKIGRDWEICDDSTVQSDALNNLRF